MVTPTPTPSPSPTPTPPPTPGQGWPAIFDPSFLRVLNLDMTPGDWNTIQNDSSFLIEVPAMFWMDGEAPILVTVRRKPSTALTSGAGFDKVALKIDINELVLGQDWHDLKKLSIENGTSASPISVAEEDILKEGFAWFVQRVASSVFGYAYQVGFSSWVRVFINGVDTGVYVNVEQRDKRFLENRDLWLDGETWLYKVAEASGGFDLKHGGPQDSPAVEDLCYVPFNNQNPCPTPDLATDVPQHVDMAGILTMLAADAFLANDDSMLTKGKNFYFADFLGGPKRKYYPWDQDSVAKNNSTNTSIYAGAAGYEVLLAVPAFRAQYNQIFNDLICGPWSEATLLAFLDAQEPVLSAAMVADPNVPTEFNNLRSWVTDRVAWVEGEIEGFQACPTTSIQLQLNELMASNILGLEDPDEPGEFPDWFEIYNPTALPVDIGGIYATDNPFFQTQYQFPAGVTIPAEGYRVLYADNDPQQGPLHMNFKLSASGEGLFLFDLDGITQLDGILFGPRPSDVSFGRVPDGSGPWDFTSLATPGLANAPHNPPPSLTDVQRDVLRPSALDVVGVSVSASDDSAIASVTLHYDAGAGEVQVAMFDDGASGDGGAGDGV